MVPARPLAISAAQPGNPSARTRSCSRSAACSSSPLPERRSRRRPHYYLHGELTGSWLWERYLRFFAQRGWEGHALNLRAHFWPETAPLEELDLETYVDDAVAGYDALDRTAVIVGHGMGGLWRSASPSCAPSMRSSSSVPRCRPRSDPRRLPT